MKTRYYINIDPDASEARCVSQELEPGTLTVLIIARTPEEAALLFQGVRA